MKRRTIAAIGLAAALVAIPTAVAVAQADQQSDQQSGQPGQAEMVCPYGDEAGMDHQTMHNEMAAMMETTGQMGMGQGYHMNDMNDSSG